MMKSKMNSPVKYFDNDDIDLDAQLAEMLEKLINVDDSYVEDESKDLKQNNDFSLELYGGKSILTQENSITSKFNSSHDENIKFKIGHDNAASNNKNVKTAFQNNNEDIISKGISEGFLYSFKGKFSFLIKNYNGSKLLQKFLPNTEEQVISKIFAEIVRDIPDLMIDPYGNYFCQKFYGMLRKGEKILFLKEILNNIFIISSNNYGNYALQTLIDLFSSDEEVEIFLKMLNHDNNLVKMIKENSAIHVIEKIIMSLPEQIISFIYEFTFQNFLNLSINQNGLFVVKKILMNCKNPCNQLRLQSLIIKNFNVLITNAIGNHVIQTALEIWNNMLIYPILCLFIGNFLKLSTMKYSSNVVEKSFEKGGEQYIDYFINEITNSNKVILLIKNSFGNYVLQKALKLARDSSKIIIINNILNDLNTLESKKLYVKWSNVCDTILQNLMQRNTYFSNKKKEMNNYTFNNKVME